MIELLIGAVAGFVGGVAAKDKIVPNPYLKQQELLQRKLDVSTKENSNLKQKVDELHKELENSVLELKAKRNEMRSKEDRSDDVEDKLDKYKLMNRRLTDENEMLKQKLNKLEMLSEVYKQELDSKING